MNPARYAVSPRTSRVVPGHDDGARESIVDVIVQIVGSLLILVPFVLVQARRMTSGHNAYLVLNAVGSVILAAEAGFTHQWGFLLLEGVWAAVSVAGVLRKLVRTSAASAGAR
jgi:hypothetical protein